MADEDLGDFFAKKDKKKNKKKVGTKVTSAKLIEQFTSDTKNEEVTTQAQKTQNTQKAESIARPDDNDWVDLDNDHLAEGLENLKIKSLDAKEEEQEQMRQQQEQEHDECHSEGEDGGKEARGPWAAVSAAPAPVHTASNENQNVHAAIVNNLVSSSGKYIPPGQRSGRPAQVVSRRGREQLKIDSKDQFPDLCGNVNPREKHDPSYDTVRATGRKAPAAQAQQQSMQLKNKFQVLGR